MGKNENLTFGGCFTGEGGLECQRGQHAQAQDGPHVDALCLSLTRIILDADRTTKKETDGAEK